MEKVLTFLSVFGTLAGMILLTILCFVLIIAEPAEGCFWDTWYYIICEKLLAVAVSCSCISLWIKLFK